MTKDTEEALHNILDTFTGADGGIKFVMFKLALEQVDERAANADALAGEVIEIVTRFSKLINVMSEI